MSIVGEGSFISWGCKSIIGSSLSYDMYFCSNTSIKLAFIIGYVSSLKLFFFVRNEIDHKGYRILK